MSSRTANLAALAGIFALGLLYFVYTQAIPTAGSGATLGPRYFPNILVAALAALCLASLVRELRATATHLEIPRPREIVITVVLTGAYYALWQLTEYFFVATPLYVFSLLFAYSPHRTPRAVAGMVAVAAVFSLFVFVIFTLLLDVRFI